MRFAGAVCRLSRLPRLKGTKGNTAECHFSFSTVSSRKGEAHSYFHDVLDRTESLWSKHRVEWRNSIEWVDSALSNYVGTATA